MTDIFLSRVAHPAFRKLLKFYFQSFLLGVPVCLASITHYTFKPRVDLGSCRRVSHTLGVYPDSSIVQDNGHPTKGACQAWRVGP